MRGGAWVAKWGIFKRRPRERCLVSVLFSQLCNQIAVVGGGCCCGISCQRELPPRCGGAHGSQGAVGSWCGRCSHPHGECSRRKTSTTTNRQNILPAAGTNCPTGQQFGQSPASDALYMLQHCTARPGIAQPSPAGRARRSQLHSEYTGLNTA